MNDILFGNNNSKVITKLSKRYFKKNKVRNLAALLAIILTAFLFTSITSLAFNMASVSYTHLCKDGYHLADSQGCRETGRPSFQKYKKIIFS